MEYMMDDCQCISNCHNTMDWESECFYLDDDNTEPLAVPGLTTVNVQALNSHQLMVPVHNRSKFMIGVKDQQDWADEFLTFD